MLRLQVCSNKNGYLGLEFRFPTFVWLAFYGLNYSPTPDKEFHNLHINVKCCPVLTEKEISVLKHSSSKAEKSIGFHNVGGCEKGVIHYPEMIASQFSNFVKIVIHLCFLPK